jgi:hypothetical protein
MCGCVRSWSGAGNSVKFVMSFRSEKSGLDLRTLTKEDTT